MTPLVELSLFLIMVVTVLKFALLEYRIYRSNRQDSPAVYFQKQMQVNYDGYVKTVESMNAMVRNMEINVQNVMDNMRMLDSRLTKIESEPALVAVHAPREKSVQ